MTTTSNLSDYLPFKRAYLDDPDRPVPTGAALTARVSAVGRAGVRTVRIRDHRFVSDSGIAGGGSDLGPIPGEFILAALGGCLNHGWIMQAALADVVLHSLVIDVATTEPPEGSLAPAGYSYTVTVESDASEETLLRLFAIVEQKSYVYRILTNPVSINGSVSEVAR